MCFNAKIYHIEKALNWNSKVNLHFQMEMSVDRNTNIYYIHCGKADDRTIGYLQPNMSCTSNDQIL